MANDPQEDKPSPLWRAFGVETGNEGRRSGDWIVGIGNFIRWLFVIAGIAAFLIGIGWGLILIARHLLSKL